MYSLVYIASVQCGVYRKRTVCCKLQLYGVVLIESKLFQQCELLMWCIFPVNSVLYMMGVQSSGQFLSMFWLKVLVHIMVHCRVLVYIVVVHIVHIAVV